MNVIKFSLQINNKKLYRLKDSIRDHLIKSYSKNTISKNYKDYYETVKNEWNNLEYKNIKALYSREKIMALSSINKVNYYLFNNQNIEVIDNNQMYVDVLMICNNSNIDLSINNVINDIKRKLKKIKVRTIKEENVHLYRFNKEEKDISLIDENSQITASFSDMQKWSKPEKAQMIFIFILTIVSFFHKSDSEAINNILIGVAGSCIFFLISVVSIKAFENIMKEERIEIKDLNNFINNELSSLYSTQSETKDLYNPTKDKDIKYEDLNNPVKYDKEIST